jgi:hypothetical protein
VEENKVEEQDEPVAEEQPKDFPDTPWGEGQRKKLKRLKEKREQAEAEVAEDVEQAEAQ